MEAANSGDGMLHWRLVNEMDAIDGLIQAGPAQCLYRARRCGVRCNGGVVVVVSWISSCCVYCKCYSVGQTGSS